MSSNARYKGLFALLAALVLALAIAACGDDDEDSTETSTTESSSTAIEENPDNNGISLTVGSKNFTEQIVLGEIYAQALEAAGYDVSTDLNLGDEFVALKALENGEISGYPEYTSTALTSFFDTAPEDVPGDPQAALDQAQADFEAKGLVAYPPTPFSSANAVGMLAANAEELGISSISDLEDHQDLTLYGSPECRQRIDCLAGLEEYYGLTGLRENFTPIDIGLRYEVLDKGDADLSILFTTDAQLFTSSDYTLLEDDKGVLPAGNVTFVASQDAADEAGPDFGETIEKVQGNLSLEVMQELNARVDIDKEKPEEAAQQYLEEFGYIQ
ncbi:MAG: glycine betaine ABC transporter substrate-binding protein [Solirubrobacterales bacterium]|jgi:osmoprotectant transport system substrate-binding protein